jgi:membrane protein
MKNFGRFWKELWQAFKQSFTAFGEIEPFNKSIVIAYYTIFSLPGLLVIIINIAGYFFGMDAVTGKITGQIQGTIGGDTAGDIERIIANATLSEGTALASVLGVATLLFGATGVFYNLQQIFNQIWEVKPKPKGKILKLIKDRVFSFGLILVVGFLLLVSLVLSAALSAVADWVSSHISESLKIIFKVLDILVSLAVITLLFAAMFKFLPDAKVRWKTVWVGAVVTSVLFVIAKFLLGLYFGKSEPGSTYGAAGTIILIMLWVSYAGMILLFGGVFTRVWANRKGHKAAPSEHADKDEEALPPGKGNALKSDGKTRQATVTRIKPRPSPSS